MIDKDNVHRRVVMFDQYFFLTDSDGRVEKYDRTTDTLLNTYTPNFAVTFPPKLRIFHSGSILLVKYVGDFFFDALNTNDMSLAARSQNAT